MKRNLSYLIPKTHCVTFMSTEWRYIIVKLNDFELSVPTERGQLSFSNINFYLKISGLQWFKKFIYFKISMHWPSLNNNNSPLAPLWYHKSIKPANK